MWNTSLTSDRPSELKGAVTLPVNVGVDATTIRAELVALATLLLAGVKGYPGGQTYTVNANGSVTADLVQVITSPLELPVNVPLIGSCRPISRFYQIPLSARSTTTT